MTTNPSGIDWANIPLRNLVELAYGVKEYSLTAPDWLADERFDITAKLPVGGNLSQNASMLQNLLVERFKLVVHHEPKMLPVYELLPGKDQSKLHPGEKPMHMSTGREGRHITGALTMARLADTLSQLSGPAAGGPHRPHRRF